MNGFKYYNIIKYIESIQELKEMTLDSTLPDFVTYDYYYLNDQVLDYFRYIKDEPFYIPPTFSDVKINKKQSSYNSKFILYSAPGATGKSSLAKYISNKYNAIYWDLSKIILGTNSFVGSIINAIGSADYSKFIDDLNNAKALLVIDAFDEAEIISGRKMISEFINDISNTLTSCVKPSVIFLARTETAQYIASFCVENNISINHYEIGFFSENQAKEFIEKSLNTKSITPADTNCINQYYNTIKTSLSENEYDSFLGYAPVLEAISKHINLYPNRAKAISNLTGEHESISIIIKIMDDLLEREQKEKVIEAFKRKCSDNSAEFSSWDKLYTPVEQLVRVLNYIMFDDKKIQNYNVDFIPDQLIDVYQEVLDTFLPQHPFIRNSTDNLNNHKIDFTGPAFRDYTLVKLLLNDKHATLADMYFEELSGNHYFPSQIFYDCYKSINNNKIYLAHISRLFESYRSKATVRDYPYLQCSKNLTNYDGMYGTAVFGMSTRSDKSERLIDKLTILPSRKNESIISIDQLPNVTMDFPDLVIRIGKSDEICRISNSTIICKRIEWGTGKVTVESYNPNGCLIVSKESILGNIPTIDIVNSDKLHVDIPNIDSYYKLRPYKYNFEDDSTADILKFTYAMRSILIEFRTHKKDTLAKDAERIDNVNVGSSLLKKQILDFLKSKDIIYREGHLYKINIQNMQKAGINYQAIEQLDFKYMDTIYQDFEKYRNELNVISN